MMNADEKFRLQVEMLKLVECGLSWKPYESDSTVMSVDVCFCAVKFLCY